MTPPRRALRIRCANRPTHVLLPGGTFRVGRDSGNDLVVGDGQASRFHCLLEWIEGTLRPRLRDLGSANGTWLDGRAVQVARLTGGETIVVGRARLRCELVDEQAPSALLDDDDRVCLQVTGDEAPAGTIAPGRLRELLWDLEADRRSGTLLLEGPEARGRFTYAGGRIAAASLDDGSIRLLGAAAVRGAVERGLAGAAYRLAPGVDPGEEGSLVGSHQVGPSLLRILGGGVSPVRVARREPSDATRTASWSLGEPGRPTERQP